ncbi:GAF domain-containing protein [Devosia sp.]|uniref:GAF domain-containing protein n=1 Tax=Devosia sp. TaxID=1871048 RepID=UPI003A8CBA54
MPENTPDMDDYDRNLRADSRLAALASFDILDTPEENEFDDIVHLASSICATPVALISLVEVDRQWFKARVGFEACETPIEQSVCAHALGQTELLIIPDLTADPRTSTNTLVAEDPAIRFYAGAPLVTDDGQIIGTLCVIDTEIRPQGLTAQQADVLRTLARQVMVLLKARKRLADGENRALRYQIAEEAGRIGTFDVSVADSRMTLSPECCRIFGVPVARTYPTSVLEQVIVPEDASVRSSDATRASGTAPVDVEYRIRRPSDGQLRWLARRAEFIHDDAGNVVRMFGTVTDVTDRRRLVTHQAALLDLGDALRNCTSPQQAMAVASQTLGETLDIGNAGYGRFSGHGTQLNLEQDWAAPGLDRTPGEYALAGLSNTVARLQSGLPLAVHDIATTEWLGTDRDYFARAGVATILAIPLLGEGGLVAMMFASGAQPRDWDRAEVDFAHGVADATYAAIARLDSQASQQLLNRELGHRMKNQLAMIQAIVSQTLRSAPDLATAGESLSNRIRALASAHDALISGESGCTTVGEIVRRTVSVHDDHLAHRFDTEGPDMIVGPQPALSLSLLLHELSTNAAKYGALSNEQGDVLLRWGSDTSVTPASFWLTWRERGGPQVTAPDRSGSGSRLIRAGLAGVIDSNVALDYDSAGLRADISADLVSFQKRD